MKLKQIGRTRDLSPLRFVFFGGSMICFRSGILSSALAQFRYFSFLFLVCSLSLMFGSDAFAQTGGGLVDENPPPAIRIHKWDPTTGTWIDCVLMPQHSACNFGGVVPVPIGPTIIPINVGGGASCGAGGFSLTGNATLPVQCSNISPCVIQGVQISCTGTATQVTCTFSTAQNGQWVPLGSTTVGINDIIDVAIDCAGSVTRTVRRFIDNHVILCPEVAPGDVSFTIGNPSDPNIRCVKILEIAF